MADGNTTPSDNAAATAPAILPQHPARHRVFRRRAFWQRARRPILLLGVPLALLVGAGYLYVTGGRYVATDNAYVKAHMVSVSSDVAGRIVAVDVHENQFVRAGTRLLELDGEPLRIALAQAEAARAAARNDIVAMKAAYRQRRADLAAAQSTLGMAQREYDRREKLLAGHIISDSDFDAARNARDVARQEVASIAQDIQRLSAGLGGNPDIVPEDHPRYREAQARVDAAMRDLRLAAIVAPADGVVSQVDRVRPGDYTEAGRPVLSLVSDRDLWVEANFKETDLTHMRPGQPAEIAVDAYPGVTFRAVIDSIGAATGAEFSLLPPQNATGNWVKVVQRVPVRLRIENAAAAGSDAPLRAGMSAIVDVDTGHHRALPGFIRSAAAWVGVE